ncbi:MAG: CRISPR-associated endonuclease Cas1 [Pseudomonadota bacterium]|nr:CRISPR-associated endonuclease Cas1 [Pseudomonadota bacterium]
MTEETVTPRTLYLSGDAGTIVMRDGPALKVRRPGVAERNFPLRRLLRVMVSGQVRWDTSALMACADARVPVSFVRADGTVRARLANGSGGRRGLLDLNGTLRIFLDENERVRIYRDWIDACARNERLRLVYEAQRGAWPTQPQVLRRLLFNRVKDQARANDVRRFDRNFRALLADLVQDRLGGLGVDTELPVLAVNEIDLVRDFAGILEWGESNAKLKFIKREYAAARRRGFRHPELDWRAAVHCFESRERDISDRFDALFRRFHQYMLETV